MKFISWNVNGLRACCEKGFKESFAALDADFFCLQETKMQEGQLDLEFEGYRSYWNYAEKKGYSGTAIFSRHAPLNVTYGLGLEEHDKEGRVITLEMPDFFLVTVYTPNSQRGLTRLMYRMCWEEDFRLYLKKLDAQKPVIVCGDMCAERKPDPECYLKAMGLLGAVPQECLVFEDSSVGIHAAKQAGIEVAAFTGSGNGQDVSEADYVVSSYEESKRVLI